MGEREPTCAGDMRFFGNYEVLRGGFIELSGRLVGNSVVERATKKHILWTGRGLHRNID